MKINSFDLWHMRSALNLARVGLGRTWPNPSVGCVVVKGGHVVGRGRTGDQGRPHAEAQALGMAGHHAKGAHVYVTLEPCAHTGQTPPCATALIKAGIAKVIIACEDTDDRVAGKGIDMLKAAGIEVVFGILGEQAKALNKGFFLRHSEGRPLISLKTATTLDAKIATSTGESKWITGDLARRRGHLIRAQHDAIAVGVNTVMADNPTLTTRLEGAEHRATRIIFDTKLRLMGTENLFKDIADHPVWVVTAVSATDDKARVLVNAGADIITVNVNESAQLDLQAAVQAISKRGITRLLIEGGATLMTSFMKLGLYDQLYWFKAGSVIGSDGLNATQALGVTSMNEKVHLSHSEQITLGDDVLDVYLK